MTTQSPLDQVGRSSGIDLGTGFSRLFTTHALGPHKDFIGDALARINGAPADEVFVSQWIDSIDFDTSIVLLMTDPGGATAGLAVIEYIPNPKVMLYIPTLDMVRGFINADEAELHSQQTRLLRQVTDIARTDAVDADVVDFACRRGYGTAIGTDFNQPAFATTSPYGNVYEVDVHRL